MTSSCELAHIVFCNGEFLYPIYCYKIIIWLQTLNYSHIYLIWDICREKMHLFILFWTNSKPEWSQESTIIATYSKKNTFEIYITFVRDIVINNVISSLCFCFCGYPVLSNQGIGGHRELLVYSYMIMDIKDFCAERGTFVNLAQLSGCKKIK